MPRAINRDCSRLASVYDIADGRTWGSSLNSAGESRSGTLADMLLEAIALPDLSTVVIGRAVSMFVLMVQYGDR